MSMLNLFKCKLGMTLLFLPLILVGCTNQIPLVFVSIPEGATISEIRTGNALGIAPTRKIIEIDSPSSLDSEGCYILEGVTARWVSGARVQTEELKLCDGESGPYAVRLVRPTEHPDLERDLEEATAVKEARISAYVEFEEEKLRRRRNTGAGFLLPTHSPTKNE